mmetsp:Transcript_72300/g.186469  ORF Transcript_72300/g.186469 Transcript_72300/m.186469 type:complete len:218 (-) Transcript_72300:532-1185(-)
MPGNGPNASSLPTDIGDDAAGVGGAACLAGAAADAFPLALSFSGPCCCAALSASSSKANVSCVTCATLRSSSSRAHACGSSEGRPSSCPSISSKSLRHSSSSLPCSRTPPSGSGSRASAGSGGGASAGSGGRAHARGARGARARSGGGAPAGISGPCSVGGGGGGTSSSTGSPASNGGASSVGGGGGDGGDGQNGAEPGVVAVSGTNSPASLPATCR